MQDQKEFFYAQINEEHICVGVSSLSGEVIQDNMIRLNNYDTSVAGKKYDDGKWLDVPQPEPSPAEKREEAYRTMLYKQDNTPLIENRGVLYTVDSAMKQVLVYKEEDELNALIDKPTERAKELGVKIPPAKEYIRNIYPEIEGAVFSVQI